MYVGISPVPITAAFPRSITSLKYSADGPPVLSFQPADRLCPLPCFVTQIGLDITVHGETVVDDGLHVVKFPRHRSVALLHEQ